MSVLVFLRKRNSFPVIGDGSVQQLNVNEFYVLGKQLKDTVQQLGLVRGDAKLFDIIITLFESRRTLTEMLDGSCPLPQASQRAARTVVDAITDIVEEDFGEAFSRDKNEKIPQYRLAVILGTISNFETILSNDMPEMSAYAVSQIGIYRTDDLMRRPERQISESLRSFLPDLALSDIQEAGKCLAFRVQTAASFHLSRAIETCINRYHLELTGKPFDGQGAERNWARKIDSLRKHGAEPKITAFLDHIREEYRNPVSHPDVIVEADEAFNFFGATLSALSMMLSAVKSLNDKKQPNIPGLEIPNGLYSQHAANAVRSDVKESSLGLPAGDTTAA